MGLRVGPPRFRATPGHTGGVFKLGAASYSYPSGSQVAFSEDRRLAFVLIKGQLHVVHEAGEVFGVDPGLLARIRSEIFNLT